MNSTSTVTQCGKTSAVGEVSGVFIEHILYYKYLWDVRLKVRVRQLVTAGGLALANKRHTLGGDQVDTRKLKTP